MKTKVYWFRYAHENRNDLLRFGLMNLHHRSKIKYIEKPLEVASKYGFSEEIAQSKHRHISFLAIIGPTNVQKKIIVDSEDSFVFTSTLIKEVDYYFSSGYNADFFEKKKVLEPYIWQNENDTSWYNEVILQKIKNLGDHFYKVRKFVPIAPNLTINVHTSYLKQKFINFKSKIFKLLYQSFRWEEDFQNYQIRYDYLKSLRNKKLNFDIILNDSLWGWPIHRINLHQKLQLLAKQGYKVNSILNWAEPSVCDGSIHNQALNKEQFPLTSGTNIENYEHMLSSSRLGVFATGFHFGWRNIMTFCLMIGIPVLIDKLKLQPYFTMNNFIMYENEEHDWEQIKSILDDIDEEKWISIKETNQSYYDKVMDPTVVANYFLNTVHTT